MQSDSLKFKILLYYILFALLLIFAGQEKNSWLSNTKIAVNKIEKNINTTTTSALVVNELKANDRTEVAEERPVNITPETEIKLADISGKVDQNDVVYYKIVKIVDGDTIDVDINGLTERVRLIGINTPEVVDPRKPVECFGREASAKAHEWLEGQEVTLESDINQDNRDKYGRLLRYLKTRIGFFYNLEIIKQGYAYEYTYNTPYEYQTEFKAAQKFAQENKLGLWADGACSQRNTGSSTGFSGSASSTLCEIKGNINSAKEKIYHLPDCPYYKNTVIDESLGEKWFCNEAEAVAAGWRKAKNCP